MISCMDKRKDIPWITLAKFLGLYLMILGHMSLVSQGLSAFIYTFHMPLFFILSGLLTNRAADKRIVVVKLYHKLIIPYLIIAAIWCFIYILLWMKNGIYDFELWLSNIFGTFISPGKPLGCLDTLRGPLWFLLALAEIKFIAIFIEKQIYWLPLSVIAILLSLLLGQLNIVLPFAMDSAILAIPFYALGVFLHQYKHIWDISKWKCLVSAIILATLTYTVYRLNGIVDLNHCHWGQNILLFYAGGFVGSMAVYYISILLTPAILKMNGVISTLVMGAMLIIGFSQNISSIIRAILPFLAGCNLGGSLIGFLTLAAIYPLILVAKRYFPAILGYR